jgi:esterase/lipase superfamily enzyme
VVKHKTNSNKWERNEDMTRLTRRDLLVFVHGFGNEPPIVLQRHRRVQADLRTFGYPGGVGSFNWPSAKIALAYLNDRKTAEQKAFAHVRD